MKILRSTSSSEVLKCVNICVSMVNATTVRVDAPEEWFSRQEAQVASTPSSSAGDISMAENRTMSKVLSRFDDEWKKTMPVEDKLSINNHEYLWTSVQNLDLDMSACEGKKERSAASTGRFDWQWEKWWSPLRYACGHGVWAKPTDLDSEKTRLNMLGGLE